MSYVIAARELMTSAATDLAGIGSNVDAAHMVAATRATSVIPAAADEVSASIAHLFSQHAANYQALAAQAAAFNDQFVQHLTAGAFSYTDIEATLAWLLQNLQNLNVNADLFVSTLTPQQLSNILYDLLVAPFAVPFLLGATVVFVGGLFLLGIYIGILGRLQ